MTKTFTQNDLIRFLYDETSLSESLEIQQALLCDSELQSCFKELLLAKNEFTELTCDTSRESLDAIINYSKSTNLRSAH